MKKARGRGDTSTNSYGPSCLFDHTESITASCIHSGPSLGLTVKLRLISLLVNRLV